MKVGGSAESNIHINILQGFPKADKMEYIIQKNTEIGVKEITPISMEQRDLLTQLALTMNEQPPVKKRGIFG